MAAAKKGASKESKGPSLTSPVRFGGKVYGAGQEEELQQAMDEAKVEAVRGFGVDSTDRGTKPVRNDSRRAEIAARVRQAADEAQGREPSGEPVNYAEVTLADLAGELAKESDADVIKKAKRKDARAGAAPLYEARLEEIKNADAGE
jgi:hypothetical protein